MAAAGRAFGPKPGCARYKKSGHFLEHVYMYEFQQQENKEISLTVVRASTK